MLLGMISLGCCKNLVDSELFLGVIRKYNIEITNEIENAQILVVNTCGFIDKAKEESLDTIYELIEIKKHKDVKIIVMGCLVTRYLKELKEEIPEVDYFIPISSYNELDKVICEIINSKEKHSIDYKSRVISTTPSSCYLRIGDGCNNNCAYCAIPLIRGSYKSRDLNDIIEEAKYLSEIGILDLTIISQDTTKYGIDLENMSLSILLERIAKLNLFKTIRVLYMYPDEITDDLINVIKKYDSICNYFDIPIQHASDKILKLMNRRGSASDIENVINKIRNAIPDAIIRTTVIVGFPNETSKDFNILKDFVKKMKFERLGAFTYSDEEDTKAYLMDKKVSDKTKQKRYEEIFEIQKEIVQEFNEKRIGTKVRVFVDSFDPDTLMFKTRSYCEASDDVDGYIYVPGDLKIGTYVDVEIISSFDYDLIGKLI